MQWILNLHDKSPLLPWGSMGTLEDPGRSIKKETALHISACLRLLGINASFSPEHFDMLRTSVPLKRIANVRPISTANKRLASSVKARHVPVALYSSKSVRYSAKNPAVFACSKRMQSSIAASTTEAAIPVTNDTPSTGTWTLCFEYLSWGFTVFRCRVPIGSLWSTNIRKWNYQSRSASASRRSKVGRFVAWAPKLWTTLPWTEPKRAERFGIRIGKHRKESGSIDSRIC